MKIQLDTEKKTIKIEEDASLEKLMSFMQATFPDNWKEYKVLTNTIINWTTYPQYVWPNWTWRPYDVYCGTSATSTFTNPHTFTTTNGTYNLEINQ